MPYAFLLDVIFGFLTGWIQINNNELRISLPILWKTRAFDVYQYEISGGCTLELFAALINHACEPNCWWVNEGTELRVRAPKDIPAGGELTFNYLSTSASEFHERRASLQYTWNFNCTCPLCSSGPDHLQPAEPLLSELSRTIDQATPESILWTPKDQKAKFQTAIKSLAATNLGLGVWPRKSSTRFYTLLVCLCSITQGF